MAFYSHLLYVMASSEAGKAIPAKVIKKLIAIFQAPIFDKGAYFTEIQKQIMAMIGKYKVSFSIVMKLKSDGQKFENPLPKIPIQKANDKIASRKFTSDEFVELFLTSMFIQSEKKYLEIISDKKVFVEFAYKILFEYLKPLPVKMHPVNNQKHILMGVLAVCFDLLLPEDEYKKSPSFAKYYTEYLSSKTEYFCKKLDKILLQSTKNQ